jgi:hypothetical protein
VVPVHCQWHGRAKTVKSGDLIYFYGPTDGSPFSVIFEGAIWYGECCGTDLLPYNGNDAFPTRKPAGTGK